MPLTLQLGPNAREFLSGRRKLKLQIRVSPKAAKVQTSSNKKQGHSGAGVAAAMDQDSYLESTDISSPIRGASRNRKGKTRAVAEPDEASEDEDFEPVREARRRSGIARTRSPLGPPITSDQRLEEANLNKIHRNMVEQFVIKAKGIDEKIRNQRGRKKPYFTEDNLREMAINWTLSVEDMMGIRGINIESVHEIGDRLLPCLQQSHDRYEEMMEEQEDRDIDENHQNVIDLVTDGDDGDSEYEQESGYFKPSAEVQAFNQRVAQAGTQSQQVQTQSKPPNPKLRTMSVARGSRAGSAAAGRVARSSGRGNFRRGGRRGSGGFPKGRAASRGSSGVAKRSSTSKRSSNGSTASRGPSNIFKSFAKKGEGGTGGGRGGIGMMPT
jgi:bloom syndrome protein